MRLRVLLCTELHAPGKFEILKDKADRGETISTNLSPGVSVGTILQVDDGKIYGEMEIADEWSLALQTEHSVPPSFSIRTKLPGDKPIVNPLPNYKFPLQHVIKLPGIYSLEELEKYADDEGELKLTINKIDHHIHHVAKTDGILYAFVNISENIAPHPDEQCFQETGDFTCWFTESGVPLRFE